MRIQFSSPIWFNCSSVSSSDYKNLSSIDVPRFPEAMVENHSHQNFIVKEEEVINFERNHIYFANDPLRYVNGENHSFESQKENKMISIKGVPCFEETRIPCVSMRNSEQMAILQMVWNKPDSEYENHFMALNENNLTDRNLPISTGSSESKNPVFEIDDTDDDDVVFVKAFPNQKTEISEDLPKVTEKITETKPRRNPTRKARNSKYGKNSDSNNIYEGDFSLLDSSDEGSSDELAPTDKSSSKQDKTQTPSMKNLKKWPVNGLHERPEFNVVTQKIEKFDYTIREIQNNNNKKPKIEELKKPKPPKKTPKKYITRRTNTKNKNVKKIETKVSLESLKELVDENQKSLTNFLDIVSSQIYKGQHRCHSLLNEEANAEDSTKVISSTGEMKCAKCSHDYQDMISNQSRLFSILNEVDYKGVFTDLKSKTKLF